MEKILNDFDEQPINPDFILAERGMLTGKERKTLKSCAMCGCKTDNSNFCSIKCKRDYFQEEEQQSEYTDQVLREGFKMMRASHK